MTEFHNPTALSVRCARAIKDPSRGVDFQGERTLASLIDREINLGGLDVDMERLCSPPRWRVWQWPAWIEDAIRIGTNWRKRIHGKAKQGADDIALL